MIEQSFLKPFLCGRIEKRDGLQGISKALEASGMVNDKQVGAGQESQARESAGSSLYMSQAVAELSVLELFSDQSSNGSKRFG